MNHPQSLIKELQTIKHAKAIELYGCCAFTYLWCLGIDPTDIKAIQLVDDAITEGVLDEECTVDWARFGAWITGRLFDVKFEHITEITHIKERTPVRYDYKGYSHWVGVEKGMICFNSLEHSNCVELGQPTSARILTIKGKI